MDFSELSDQALMGKIEGLVETERFSLVDFLLHLGELDRRKACDRTSHASIFNYLTRHLGFSESDAVRRVRVAQAARKYPSILGMLGRGELHIVGVSLLVPVLTPENHQRLLKKASRRSTREIDRMVADLRPSDELPRDRIRAQPAPHKFPDKQQERPAAADLTAPVLSPTCVGSSDTSPGFDPAPLFSHAMESAQAPEAAVDAAARRVEFTFTASEEVRDLFNIARDLLRHRFPMGRMEDVIGEALRRLIKEEQPGKIGRRRKIAAADPESRRIAKWIRDEVWRRDGGRCSYLGLDGARCGETGWLEFDHIVPWALGGKSDEPENIRLLCRVHNVAEARRIFGDSN